MSYEETIKYLYSALPMFSRIGTAAYKKDLGNTVQLCAALGNPQEAFTTIHIAGTNGKGSVSHMLAAILQSAGYTTGLYTSPHLKDFRERIKVNGELCSKEFVVDFTETVKPLIASIQPSFFEITVAMAFTYFAASQVDVAIIETGLGGRLDSTNVIYPALSVITNIGWDHMNLLGETLELIAFEKAGIIKQYTPAVIGEYLQETKPVFIAKATEQNAPVSFAQEQWYVADWSYEHHLLRCDIVQNSTGKRDSYTSDLTGVYQLKNIVTVLESVHQLQQKGWEITDAHIKTGLSAAAKITGLHGRWEQIHHRPTIILDVAHNEDGIRQVAAQLELMTYRHLHIVTGMVKDKAVDKVLALLPKHATYYFTRSQIPRALPEQEFAKKARDIGLNGKTFPEVNMAIKDALTHAHEDDVILVCGSVFLVGEVAL